MRLFVRLAAVLYPLFGLSFAFVAGGAVFSFFAMPQNIPGGNDYTSATGIPFIGIWLLLTAISLIGFCVCFLIAAFRNRQARLRNVLGLFLWLSGNSLSIALLPSDVYIASFFSLFPAIGFAGTLWAAVFICLPGLLTGLAAIALILKLRQVRTEAPGDASGKFTR